MEISTQALILLQDQKGIKPNLIKETLKVSVNAKSRDCSQALAKLKKDQAVEKIKQELIITGAGQKRLPRIKEQLTYNLPYWLKNWTMLIFEIPETEKNKRDQLRYRLKKAGFGMIQASIWVSPRPISKKLNQFIEDSKLEKRVKVFRFSINKDDLDMLINQAWPIKKLDKDYQKYVEEAKKQFLLVRTYTWPDLRIKKRALKLLAEVYKERYHDLRKRDPELPKSILSANWQGFRAFHIYQQLGKYL